MQVQGNDRGYLHVVLQEADNSEGVEVIRKFIQKEIYAEDVIVLAREEFLNNIENGSTTHRRGFETAAILKDIWEMFYDMEPDTDDDDNDEEDEVIVISD